MRINFSNKEIEILKELNIKTKDDYEISEIIFIEEKITDRILTYFDNGEPTEKVLLAENIIEKLVRMEDE